MGTRVNTTVLGVLGTRRSALGGQHLGTRWAAPAAPAAPSAPPAPSAPSAASQRSRLLRLLLRRRHEGALRRDVLARDGKRVGVSFLKSHLFVGSAKSTVAEAAANMQKVLEGTNSTKADKARDRARAELSGVCPAGVTPSELERIALAHHELTPVIGKEKAGAAVEVHALVPAMSRWFDGAHRRDEWDVVYSAGRQLLYLYELTLPAVYPQVGLRLLYTGLGALRKTTPDYQAAADLLRKAVECLSVTHGYRHKVTFSAVEVMANCERMLLADRAKGTPKASSDRLDRKSAREGSVREGSVREGSAREGSVKAKADNMLTANGLVSGLAGLAGREAGRGQGKQVTLHKPSPKLNPKVSAKESASPAGADQGADQTGDKDADQGTDRIQAVAGARDDTSWLFSR